MSEEPETKVNDLAPGSVIHADSLLMRTRFGNWVSDGGFVVTDTELEADLAACFWAVVFDAGDLWSTS